MVTGGYFCSAGHTEAGGMDAFLRKLAPHVHWQRCFPAVSKPAPKLGRPHAVPSTEHSGTTGQQLVERMLDCLQRHHRGRACQLDFVLLIDDADCRFASTVDARAARTEWEAELTRQVRQYTDRPTLGFYVLLASPEIEAWLMADWENGFGRAFPDASISLRQHFETCVLPPLSWDRMEEFGGRLIGGSCETKLSRKIAESFDISADCQCRPPLRERIQRQAGKVPISYSKRIDGPAMLKRIEPSVVARRCPSFRVVYERLRQADSFGEAGAG